MDINIKLTKFIPKPLINYKNSFKNIIDFSRLLSNLLK